MGCKQANTNTPGVGEEYQGVDDSCCVNDTELNLVKFFFLIIFLGEGDSESDDTGKNFELDPNFLIFYTFQLIF